MKFVLYRRFYRYCYVAILVYSGFYLLSLIRRNFSQSLISKQQSVRKPLILDCTGDPLKKWCKNQIHMCNLSLVIYNNLFAKTESVVVQRKFAKGNRRGGEDLHQVMRQDEDNEYFHFEKGFIQLFCEVSLPAEIILDSYLTKILSTLTSYRQWPKLQTINDPTIAVKRLDYANFYHTITHLYTVYIICRFFRYDPKTVRILFLDSHPKGGLDMLWSELFHSYHYLGHLNMTSSIAYRELIWSPLQMNSELDLLQQRRIAPSYFFDFRRHVLQNFNIYSNSSESLNCKHIRIFFILRQNYIAHPRNPTGEIQRKLTNDDQILQDLHAKFQKFSFIRFRESHFEALAMQRQLSIMSQTDIFIGMHGAGLTHVLFMKSNRTLIELTTTEWQTQTHFEYMASINNVNYHRCLILDGHSTTVQTIFNCIMKVLLQLCPTSISSLSVGQ